MGTHSQGGDDSASQRILENDSFHLLATNSDSAQNTQTVADCEAIYRGIYKWEDEYSKYYHYRVDEKPYRSGCSSRGVYIGLNDSEKLVT